jgi:hypothetical protein
MNFAIRSSLPAVGVSLALILLSGCGSGADDSRTSAAANRAPTSQSPDADLVSAVKSETTDAPLTLRFELQQHPKVGGEFGLRLRVESTEALGKLQVRFEVPEGLAWSGAEPTLHESKVPAGAKMDRSARIRALRAGIYELRAVAAAETAAGQGSAATFSIPLIVD